MTYNSRILFLLALTLALLSGCSSPAYKSFHYQYQAPAEYEQLSSQHKTIAVKVNGEVGSGPLSPAITGFHHGLDGLLWVDRFDTADIQLSIFVKKTRVYRDTITEHVEDIINSNGKKQRIKTYSYPGLIQTPYKISLYDRINQQTISDLDQTHDTKVSGSAKQNKKAAQSSLVLAARVKKSDSRKEALAEIHQQTRQLLDTSLTIHTKKTVLNIPTKNLAEPRLAQAYDILSTQLSPKSATQAIAIYRAISADNDNQKNRNDELNKAVYHGLAACYYILGDMEAYKQNKLMAEHQTLLIDQATTDSDF